MSDREIYTKAIIIVAEYKAVSDAEKICILKKLFKDLHYADKREQDSDVE